MLGAQTRSRRSLIGTPPRTPPPMRPGKKYLHTAVVRLPFVHPPLLAHVVQEALRGGVQLSEEEQVRQHECMTSGNSVRHVRRCSCCVSAVMNGLASPLCARPVPTTPCPFPRTGPHPPPSLSPTHPQARNRIQPADLIVSTSEYGRAVAALSAADKQAGAPTTAAAIAWHLLLTPPAAALSASQSAAPSAAPPAPTTTAAAQADARTPAPAPASSVGSVAALVGGALGLLLSRQQQRQETATAHAPAPLQSAAGPAAAAAGPSRESPVVLCLDVAGLPVAATNAALLEGGVGLWALGAGARVGLAPRYR